MFILTTYGIDSRSSKVIHYIELAIVIDLCLDWVVRLLMAENRLAYLFALQSLISYATISSSFFCLFSEDIEKIDVYEMKFIKVFRILSLARLEEVLKRRNMPFGRAIFSLAFESLAIIFLFASGMLILENRFYLNPEIQSALAEGNEDHGIELLVFHDLVYYTVVSITTTGYGDISPQTTYG